jgi:hypothetical protein
MHKHFAQKVEDSYDGKIYPRVFRISVGDIFTTNMFADNTTLVKGDKVAPGDDGILDITTETSGLIFQVAKETTMPDGQPAVKLQCISA